MLGMDLHPIGGGGGGEERLEVLLAAFNHTSETEISSTVGATLAQVRLDLLSTQ